MNQSPTPKTDALAERPDYVQAKLNKREPKFLDYDFVVPADFARSLERHVLALETVNEAGFQQAQEDLEKWKAEAGRLSRNESSMRRLAEEKEAHIKQLETALAESQRERDAARAAEAYWRQQYEDALKFQ